ncbi:MAG: EGF domain-containing protein [Vicinamibacterales bacterium]
MRFLPRDWVIGLLVVGAGVVLTLPVKAQVSAGGVIRACVQQPEPRGRRGDGDRDGGGQIRIIGANEACRRGEVLMTWNIQGPAGPAGPAGARGNQGPMGLVGPTGPAGKDGHDGLPGNIGPAGPQGKAGIPGNQGPEGPVGSVGPQGPQGAQGEPFAGGRIMGYALDSCNRTPYQGLVAIPGISVVAWSDATGHFDLLNVPPGNFTLAFVNTPLPPLPPVHANSVMGQTFDVGMVLYGACQPGPTSCQRGYSFDGTACVPINACENSSVCGAAGTCNNTGPGTYTCDCAAGYASDGQTCRPINVCVLSSVCGDLGLCTSTGPGTYVCTCPAGYTGDGVTCVPIKPPGGGNMSAAYLPAPAPPNGWWRW